MAIPVPGDQPLDDPSGVVETAIVDEDNLHLGQRLRNHALHGLVQKGRGIVARDNDGHLDWTSYAHAPRV